MNRNPSNYQVWNASTGWVSPSKIKVDSLEPSITDTLFRAEYVPYMDAHSKIGKQNITNPMLAKTSIYDNQSEKVIDLNRFGLNLYGKINRTGNKELTIDTVENSFDKLLNVGDIYNDYVVVSRTYQIFKEFIKVQYKLSKDYNNISERIAINRERRLYNIPIENLKRDIFIKDYILASTTVLTIPTSKKALLSNSGVSYFLDTLSNDESKPVILSVVETKTSTGTTYGPFELGFYSYPMANTLNYKTKFYDNYSAGFSVQAKDGQVVGGKKVVHNRYVDDIGECETLKITLACGFGVYHDIETQVVVAKTLPKTDIAYYVRNILSNESAPYKIKKDAFEHIEITYTIEARPTISDANTIIIGNAFISNNNLLHSVNKQLKVYFSFENYNHLDNKIKPNSNTSSSYYFTISSYSIEVTGNHPDAISWAIGDEEGNLYIACNDKSKNNILLC